MSTGIPIIVVGKNKIVLQPPLVVWFLGLSKYARLLGAWTHSKTGKERNRRGVEGKLQREARVKHSSRTLLIVRVCAYEYN